MDGLKVIHLNTYDGNGGAGRACLRLNKALNDQGIASEVWVGFKFSKNPLIHSFSGGAIRRAATALSILAERYLSSSITKKLKIPFSVPLFGTDVSKHKALKEADIVHIHWINHAFLKPKHIHKLSRLNKPIVWTFHDSNAFTGGCHVRYSCNHFEHECGNCPLLKISNRNDRSHQIWEEKSRAYQGLGFSVIAPSRWMKASAGRSSLIGGKQVVNIPNTLDTNSFKPFPKAKAKANLGISDDKFVIMSGFMPSKNDLHKGTPYLLEALEHLIRLVPKDKIELVIFGNRDSKNIPKFPVSATFLGTISSDEKLALSYSAADVFVTPSLEDNLPNTVMESLSCGTPVVAFTTGGIPDMVGHKQNGYLAEYKSSAELAKGIEWVYSHPSREALNAAARDTVVKNFSEPVVAASHIRLYNQLLKQRK